MKEQLITSSAMGRGGDLENVEVFLKFEGTNGGSTFIDSSGKGRIFTRNGASTTTSTTQVKVGTSSGKFVGSSKNQSSIYTPTDSALDLAEKDFTIEFWLYPQAWATIGPVILQWGQRFIGNWVGVGLSNGLFAWELLDGSNSVLYSLISPTVLAANQWSHVALVRSGTTVKVFINGNEDISGTYAGSFTAGVSRLTIGEFYRADADTQNYPYTGYMDQLKITVGKALYNGNFIVGE